MLLMGTEARHTHFAPYINQPIPAQQTLIQAGSCQPVLTREIAVYLHLLLGGDT